MYQIYIFLDLSLLTHLNASSYPVTEVKKKKKTQHILKIQVSWAFLANYDYDLLKLVKIVDLHMGHL